jgi:hypothetical protein
MIVPTIQLHFLHPWRSEVQDMQEYFPVAYEKMNHELREKHEINRSENFVWFVPFVVINVFKSYGGCAVAYPPTGYLKPYAGFLESCRVNP